jgi:hypothetical protein
VWILGKREPYWKPGDPARQEGEKAGSWLQTAEEKRHSKTAKDRGDGLATPSRDGYAQSECIVQQLYSITITGTVFHCIIYFRKINYLVPVAICIHPLMYGKLCRAHPLQTESHVVRRGACPSSFRAREVKKEHGNAKNAKARKKKARIRAFSPLRSTTLEHDSRAQNPLGRGKSKGLVYM